MNKVTKYHNNLNTVPMRKWTTEEQNFFFAIITEARDKGDDLLRFKKENLIELANYSMERNKDLRMVIIDLVDKLETMKYREQTDNSYTSMALFQYFKAEWTNDLSDFTLDVQVSNRFSYIINKLEAEFTYFELKQFTNIRSTYAKEMFKKLKQWRTIGVKEYSVKEFREMLQIPDSYRAREIDTRVLAPIKRELPEYFKNLRIKRIKGNTRGNPILAYKFIWKPEKTGKWVKDKYKKKKKEKSKLPNWLINRSKIDTSISERKQKELQNRLKKIRE
ncbi:MAG: replication initiation protein [Staphylococcus equorum]|nr:replication initiation protein [Staphylococcus equorum]MDN6735947.1 replication initiation protein [Tetragenococcus koreensis]